jgi:hypothetical protein
MLFLEPCQVGESLHKRVGYMICKYEWAPIFSRMGGHDCRVWWYQTCQKNWKISRTPIGNPSSDIVNYIK